MTPTVRRALTSWIAMFAILFGALAPTLAHAFVRSADPRAAAFPVCSAAGHAAPDAKQGRIDLGADPFKHCPFCADQHHTPGLLPHLPAAMLVIGSPVLPSLFYQAPEPLFHWAATRSRGPPAVS